MVTPGAVQIYFQAWARLAARRGKWMRLVVRLVPAHVYAVQAAEQPQLAMALERETGRNPCGDVGKLLIRLVFPSGRGWEYATRGVAATCLSVLAQASACAALRSAFSLRASAWAACARGVRVGGVKKIRGGL
jgi:hypothetical protein